jgi:hypothetical protein
MILWCMWPPDMGIQASRTNHMNDRKYLAAISRNFLLYLNFI